MPKFTPNKALIESLSGAIGDLLFYRDAGGNLIVQHKGKRTVPPSIKQVARNDLMKLASVFGNRVKVDPILAAEYRASCRGRMRPYHAAVRDFMNPPKVVSIDVKSLTGQPGQRIHIVATDDTRVMSVQVVIRDTTSGMILEEGPAALTAVADEWLYTPTTAFPSGASIEVEATAADRPGHLAAAKAHFVVP